MRLKSTTFNRLLFSILAMMILSCNGLEVLATAPSGRTLVVYYSFTGNVRSIVNTLDEKINADVVEIQPAEEGLDYAANNYAIGSSLIAAIRNNPNDASSYPAIKDVGVEVESYDNIIIATPLWWSQMAAPMQTFLFHNGHKMSDKNIALIVSSASSGIGGVVSDAKRLIPNGNFLEPNLWIKSSQVSNASSMTSQWLEQIIFPTITNDDTISVKVGDNTFFAILEDNATAQAFRELCPLTINMSELNGNEKYHYLDTTLPTHASCPGTINAGDIMLYGSSCVVVFYKTFTTTYSYTKIGHIVDSSQSLPQALGDGDVTMSFGHDETAISAIRVDKMSDNIYYTIDGRVVTNPGPGIYIHKGKKIKL